MQWRWDVDPPAGTPNRTTGGTTWMPGTYDTDLNLLYWGTGNPTPVLNGNVRPGDDLYTGSIVALNPDTGKLVWAFQASPHDTHDWDAVETPVLVDGNFDGKPRKMLMQASRNGYYFVLDRVTGESLLTVPFGPTNWTLGVDKQGRPIPNPSKEPAPDGRFIAPDEGGMTNYRSPSSIPRQDYSWSTRTTATASTSPSPPTGPTAGQAPTMVSGVMECSRRSTIRLEKFAGATSSDAEAPGPACSPRTPASSSPGMAGATCSLWTSATAKLSGTPDWALRCKARRLLTCWTDVSMC